MVSVVMALLVASANTNGSKMPVAPTKNARCFGSPEFAGIDIGNVPVGTSVDTSVINIWAFTANGRSATAWLFKNAIDDYYVQFSTDAKESKFRDIKFYWRYFKGSGPYAYVPVRVSPSQIVSIENVLGARGIVRVSCLTHDYKM